MHSQVSRIHRKYDKIVMKTDWPSTTRKMVTTCVPSAWNGMQCMEETICLFASHKQRMQSIILQCRSPSCPSAMSSRLPVSEVARSLWLAWRSDEGTAEWQTSHASVSNSPPVNWGAKYGDLRNLHVCMFVWLSTYAYLKNHSPNFTIFSLHVTYGRGSVLLWLQFSALCTSGFVGDVMWRHIVGYMAPGVGNINVAAMLQQVGLIVIFQRIRQGRHVVWLLYTLAAICAAVRSTTALSHFWKRFSVSF